MVRSEQVQTYTLGMDTLKMIKEDAKRECLGGQSQIRSGQQRQEFLLVDQVVGLIGNYVGAVWRDGDARAYSDWRFAQANFGYFKGDHGYDLPRCQIDFKASLMRYSQDPLAYNLLVQAAERHEGWVYVCVLVENFDQLQNSDRLSVYVAGWLTDEELPDEFTDKPGFSEVYAVPVPELHPMIPLRYVIGI